MATNAAAWLRDYLTARDLETEVAGGLAVERVAAERLAAERLVVERRSDAQSAATPWGVDHLSHKPLTLERLPSPLPARVRSVAVLALIVFGVLCGAGTLFVLGGAAAVVIMPLAMGREGVGTAMITLFAVCVTFVISGILLLAARGAARVIRRERRGVRALYSFCVAASIVAALAIGISQWLSVAFMGLSMTETDRAPFDWSIVVRVVQVLFLVFFVRVAWVMRRYDREISAAMDMQRDSAA